ncbi:hypothetical protein EVAR_69249_1 [Eumeta japonica]|uniref:Uncharacterized protein n=1 Tax=Eumeta variegata TaxID=151549 RepID=A0A4C1SW25_EUMVA|nr:hypothetical protein EVAR_69249_1 [Eumeta japonica]
MNDDELISRRKNRTLTEYVLIEKGKDLGAMPSTQFKVASVFQWTVPDRSGSRGRGANRGTCPGRQFQKAPKS